MNVKMNNNSETQALTILGGKEQYQNARREYLEFVFAQEGHTVEELEGLLSAEGCAALTLEDPATGEQFVHEGYVLRGPARVFCDEDGAWKIGVKRYQETELEKTVAALQTAVGTLMAARDGQA